MRSIIKKPVRKINKKAQITGIIAFVGVVLFLIFVAPILLKVIIIPSEKLSTSLSTIDTSNRSSDAVDFIKTKATSTFDWMIMILFIFNVLLLLITSFLVDVHPAFFIVYVIAVFFLVILAPSILESINMLWDSNQFNGGDGSTSVTQYLPLLDFLRSNFGIIILSVIVISGIVMFAKFRMSGGSGGNANYY